MHSFKDKVRVKGGQKSNKLPAKLSKLIYQKKKL